MQHSTGYCGHDMVMIDMRRSVALSGSSAGTIAIVEGRHPVIEALAEAPFQPNDTFMADTSSFHIIGGPNMAGKSTYLRQARRSAQAQLISP